MYKILNNAVNYEGVLCFLFKKEKRGNWFFPKKNTQQVSNANF